MRVNNRPVISVKVSKRLKRELGRIAHHQRQSLSSLMAWLLEIVVPIAESERKYRILPSTQDPGPLLADSTKVTLEECVHDSLCHYACECNQSLLRTTNQFLWIGVEYYNKFVAKVPLRKEELSRLIREDVTLKSSR